MAHAAFHPHCHFDGRQRSGEISLLNSMCGIETGDLSTQSLNGTDTTPAIPACSPARDDRAAGSVKGNIFPPYTRHPERQRRISVSMVSEGKGSQYQWAGRKHVLILAVSCPAVNSRGALKSPRNGARGIPPPLSFRAEASAEMNHTRHGADEKEPRNLTPQ